MRFRTLLIVALLPLAGCGDGFFSTARFVTSLREARARWASGGIDTYEVTIRRLCFCGFIEPVRVRVEDGVIVSRTIVTTGEPVPAVHAQYIPDIAGLFAIVEQASREADELETEFDPTYGFPSVISIDWDENAIDDEQVYRAEQFEPES
jgi:hypothetical protein